MEKLRAFVSRNCEEITILVVLVSVVFVSYAVDEKMMMLNFYYLPVLMAGYFIGKRASVLVALFSILGVTLFVIVPLDRPDVTLELIHHFDVVVYAPHEHLG